MWIPFPQCNLGIRSNAAELFRLLTKIFGISTYTMEWLGSRSMALKVVVPRLSAFVCCYEKPNTRHILMLLKREGENRRSPKVSTNL